MYKYCINLYVRKRQNTPYFYCKDKKGIILLDECKNCLKRQIKANKCIRKRSADKITVSKDTYNKVIERDKHTCRLLDCTCEGWLELHHIVYRSEDKNLINEPSNCIMLCVKHHKQVHSNKHYWQPRLKELIKK